MIELSFVVLTSHKAQFLDQIIIYGHLQVKQDTTEYLSSRKAFDQQPFRQQGLSLFTLYNGVPSVLYFYVEKEFPEE